MKVCIVGAGNIGLTAASVISLANHEVVVYTSKDIPAENITFHDAETDQQSSDLNITISSDIATAAKDAQYILCTYPAFLREDFINRFADFLEPETRVGFIPGYGGAEYMCKKLRAKGVVIFGLQRVPFVARKNNWCATLLSRKTELFVATLPKSMNAEICSDIQSFFGITTTPLKEYLAVTLAPSNPLLHLVGLYNVLKDYCEGEYFDRQLMLYEEWTDSASELLLKYDAEVQEICHRLPMDLSEVKSLALYYESNSASAMTQKLQSIEAFKIVEIPLIKQEEKYYPDFQSRMFIEDFPFGLVILKSFAMITQVETPVMNLLLDFYEKMTGICYFKADGTPGKDAKQSGMLSNYGINTIEEVVRFYQ